MSAAVKAFKDYTVMSLPSLQVDVQLDDLATHITQAKAAIMAARAAAQDNTNAMMPNIVLLGHPGYTPDFKNSAMHSQRRCIEPNGPKRTLGDSHLVLNTESRQAATTAGRVLEEQHHRFTVGQLAGFNPMWWLVHDHIGSANAASDQLARTLGGSTAGRIKPSGIQSRWVEARWVEARWVQSRRV